VITACLYLDEIILPRTTLRSKDLLSGYHDFTGHTTTTLLISPLDVFQDLDFTPQDSHPPPNPVVQEHDEKLTTHEPPKKGSSFTIQLVYLLDFFNGSF
jgi:hypothetical protein